MLNYTPDSFSDGSNLSFSTLFCPTEAASECWGTAGGKFNADVEEAVRRIAEMAAQGPDPTSSAAICIFHLLFSRFNVSVGSPKRADTLQVHGSEPPSAGADIVDIGGQSTRPNAPIVDAEEEADRVVPVIRAARERGIDVAISVDTFRASVARDAVAAGANFINDVSPRPQKTYFY